MKTETTGNARSAVCCPKCMAKTRTSIRYGDVLVRCDHCGYDFEVVIRVVEPCEVSEAGAAPAKTAPPAAAPAPHRPKPFQGGPLAFAPDRITLCGVTVVTDKGTGQAMMMLAELAKKERGRFVRRSAEDLKKVIGSDSVQTITGCAKTIRTNIQARLRKDLGLLCSDQDVLVRDGQGYHLQDWIEVGGAEEGEDGPVSGAVTKGHDPADVPGDRVMGQGHEPAIVPSSVPGDMPGLNERQKWAVEVVRGGKNLMRIELEEKFGVSSKTAKRDLEALVKAGRIEFARKPHPGFYRLKKI